jgi:uncharacterized membrane protein (DUF485 family)
MDTKFALQMLGLLVIYCIIMGAIGLVGFTKKWLNRALMAGMVVGGVMLWDQRKAMQANETKEHAENGTRP